MHPARNHFFFLRFSSCQHFSSLDNSEHFLLLLLTQLKFNRDQDFFNIVNSFFKGYFMWRKMTASSPNVLKSSKSLIILCQRQQSQNFHRCISTVALLSHALNLTSLESKSTLNSQVLVGNVRESLRHYRKRS